jgi:predicted ATPase
MTALGASPSLGPAEPIPLTVLTGFLGAGKTSLLNRLVTDAALAETAVIINEFGEIGLDICWSSQSVTASCCCRAAVCAARCAATSSTRWSNCCAISTTAERCFAA